MHLYPFKNECSDFEMDQIDLRPDTEEERVHLPCTLFAPGCVSIQTSWPAMIFSTRSRFSYNTQPPA